MNVVLCRGKSTSNKQAAFRECFMKLGELRSLVPTTFVVLTAQQQQKKPSKKSLMFYSWITLILSLKVLTKPM